MEYNYLEAMHEDIRDYIDENKDEILEAYVVDLTYSYQGIWDDLVEGY